MAAQQPERVAVVVVHGVADQKPNASVRHVSNLLSGSVDAGELFTRTVLENYKDEGPEATYETIRVRAERQSAGVGNIAVDLYEMYWADLSRVGTSAWRILGELYQVLLHLPSLGKHAASATRATHKSIATTVFQAATALAAWTLSVPIAVFNVFFIVAAVLVLASELPVGAHAAIALGVLAAGVVALAITGLLRAVVRRPLPIVMTVILGGIAAVLVGRNDWGLGTPLLGVEALLVGVALAFIVVRSYASHRPGTTIPSFAALLIVLVTAAYAVAAARSDTTSLPQFKWIAEVGFRITESLFVALVLSWVVFFISLYASIGFGSLHVWAQFRARRQHGRRSRREAWSDVHGERRSVRTARVALAVPAALFLFLTVALWAGVDKAVETPPKAQPIASQTATRFSPFEQTYHVGALTRRLLDLPVNTGSDFVKAVLASSLGSGITLASALLALGTLLTVIPVAPIVIHEVFPPASSARARNFGAWLSAVLAVLRFTGALIIAGVATIALVDLVKEVFPPAWHGGCTSLDWSNVSQLYACAVERSGGANQFVTVLAMVVAGGTAGLIAFRGRLQSLAGGFRAPVDVSLDVDGYFREHPKGRAPRARIFARFASLLNYLAFEQYTKVVVIAHSQGTVITADLFRHLMIIRKALPVPNVRLFTMGSPLRQLYGRRFPHMYGWAWNEARPAAAVLQPPDINGKPDPVDIGAAVWVNAYRSGDYIGRWLWRPDQAGYLFDNDAPVTWKAVPTRSAAYSCDANKTRFERCIGAGAHTHYWDGTAPEIATELDYLIRN